MVAAEHGLPAERTGLEATAESLRGLADDLRDAGRLVPGARRDVEAWAEAVERLVAARTDLAADRRARDEAAEAAAESASEHAALRESVGDGVAELQAKVAASSDALAEAVSRRDRAGERLKLLHRDEGLAQGTLLGAEDAVDAHLRSRADVLLALAAVDAAPGLLTAAGASGEASTVAALGHHPAAEPVARQPRADVERLAALSADDSGPATTAFWQAYREATSGAAADHQPGVAEFGDLLAVSARDDAGEAEIVALAARVDAGVLRDRDLLTDREKKQFEQHVLGELGDAIRGRRRDAEELVVAMNDQLGHVTTSQGIGVRLDWRLRDDVPPEARAAVELLAQPVGALIPEERERLRDVLHRLIEASRSERPELSYGEHLSYALDYRTWSEFSIRFRRPERPDHWDRLHKRSPLSQGEQKVLCYLPLFAAAAAHFTSLAGAAPHAPRLILLDDAFPKIDVRTHPLLFGLLVDLDLDFVITSERLWGDHDTVPSLAIYEALRDPGQRGIAQYEYRWDGRRLRGVG